MKEKGYLNGIFIKTPVIAFFFFLKKFCKFCKYIFIVN